MQTVLINIKQSLTQDKNYPGPWRQVGGYSKSILSLDPHKEGLFKFNSEVHSNVDKEATQVVGLHFDVNVIGTTESKTPHVTLFEILPSGLIRVMGRDVGPNWLGTIMPLVEDWFSPAKVKARELFNKTSAKPTEGQPKKMATAKEIADEVAKKKAAKTKSNLPALFAGMQGIAQTLIGLQGKVDSMTDEEILLLDTQASGFEVAGWRVKLATHCAAYVRTKKRAVEEGSDLREALVETANKFGVEYRTLVRDASLQRTFFVPIEGKEAEEEGQSLSSIHGAIEVLGSKQFLTEAMRAAKDSDDNATERRRAALLLMADEATKSNGVYTTRMAQALVNTLLGIDPMNPNDRGPKPKDAAEATEESDIERRERLSLEQLSFQSAITEAFRNVAETGDEQYVWRAANTAEWNAFMSPPPADPNTGIVEQQFIRVVPFEAAALILLPNEEMAEEEGETEPANPYEFEVPGDKTPAAETDNINPFDDMIPTNEDYTDGEVYDTGEDVEDTEVERIPVEA